MFGKKTSTFRAITNSLGITAPEKSGWERFKASSTQLWADDKASVNRAFETDHKRRLEITRARNTFNVGFLGPQPEKPSTVLVALGWVVSHPAEATAAVAVGAAAGKWIADRMAASGAPKGEPEAK